MLQPFTLNVLVLPTLVIFAFTAGIGLLATRAPLLSLLAATLKSGLYLFYFSYFFDGTFTFSDDWEYLRETGELYVRHLGFFDLFGHWLAIYTIAGNHFMFQIFSTYAYRMFGIGYYAPVALSILVTPLIAWLGAQLAAREFGFRAGLHTLFFFCVLLFPNTLLWAGLINGKDILVLFFHVVFLYAFSLFFRNRIVLSLLLMGVATFFTFFLRFYLPLAFASAFVLSAMLSAQGGGRIRLLVVAVLLLVGALAVVGQGTLMSVVPKLRSALVNPAYGLVRFLLTPIPLHTDADFHFLEVPAVVQWIMLPVSAFGILAVAQMRTAFSRVFLCYFGLFVALYSVYGELQGPRHRMQLDYAWIVFQFMGLVALVRDATQRRPAKISAGPPV